jgi:CTP:molybdopterin cytidylyltransferase MocA
VTDGTVVGAVLAAGASRRFGDGPKQLARFAGRPLIEHPVAALAAARSVQRTVVVLGHEAEAIRRDAELAPAEPVIAGDWENGQSAALRAAVAAAGPDAAVLVVVLGDQPLIAPAAIDAVVAGAGERPARACYRSRPGHPVAIPRCFFADLREVEGDRGARGVLAGLGIRPIDCDGLGSAADVDTVADIAALADRR